MPNALTLLKFRDLYIVIGEYPLCEDSEQRDFLFHSHQCTENLLRSVVAVFDPEQGPDPHSILRYVAQIEDNDASRAGLDNADLQALFALFKTDGQPPPSRWPEEDHGMLPGLADERRARATKGDA